MLTFLPWNLGGKKPHFGELYFEEDAYKLELRSMLDEARTIDKGKTKKIIDLKGNLTD